jgi:hypothetical protein
LSRRARKAYYSPFEGEGRENTSRGLSVRGKLKRDNTVGAQRLCRSADIKIL